MGLALFGKGMLVGFAIAAPVGPVGVVCIRRGLLGGMGAALIAGLGAAAGDALFGGLAGFGVSLITDLLQQHDVWLKLFGGAALCVLGWRTCRQPAPESGCPTAAVGPVANFVSSFLLTIANPATLVAFIVAFSAMQLDHGDIAGWRRALLGLMLTVGVFTGAFLWWSLLAGTVTCFRHRLNGIFWRYFNAVSGGVIAAFGVAAIAHAAYLIFRS